MSKIHETDPSTGVVVKDVNFKSNGIDIAGLIYLPADIESGPKPRPAIVVGHPAAGVKEQTAGLYSRLLAERGFIALTFDTAYQGESGGTPRDLEDPGQRMEDIKSAFSFLTTFDIIDPKRMGLLGICASGGYGVAAVATDHRIKAIATVSATDIGRQFRNGGDGHQNPAVIQGMLDYAATDRNEVAKGNEPAEFPIFPKTIEEAKNLDEHSYEGWEYYRTDRAQNPHSARGFQWRSVELIAGFDAFRFADFISPRPLLMIAGTKAVTLWMTEEAMATAKEPKELFMIEGATHVALYDKMEFVTPAVVKLDSFFKEKLLK